MSSLLNIIIEPAKVFMHIKEKDDWWIPFILIVVVALIATLITAPAISRITAQMMTESGVDMEIPAVFGIIRFIAIPVGILILWFIISVIFWMLANAFGGDWNFVKALDLFAYASVVGVIKSIITVTVLLIRGLENIVTLRDIGIATGLTLFFQPENPKLYTLVSGIDIFEIWIYTLVAFGISELAGISRKKAVIASIITFIVALGFKVIFARRGAF